MSTLAYALDYLLTGRFFVKYFFAVDNAFLFILVCECKQLRDMCFAGSIGVDKMGTRRKSGTCPAGASMSKRS
jgi:hypothetical protein